MEGASAIRIGVDFDNTIVCYDEVFHRLALTEGLIPDTLPRDKTSVRNYLRAMGREDRWTAVQGSVYGERMSEALPFPGVVEFFAACKRSGLPVCIISHRTRQPIVGEPCDLHAAAFRWLTENGFLDYVPQSAIWFEETRQGKAARVREAGCTDFIDDLPEFFAEPLLPPGIRRILFNPAGGACDQEGLVPVASWEEIRALFCV